MNSLLNGEVYNHNLNNWKISWESFNNYRHWCLQSYPNNQYTILVVMFNPGSLSGNGENLSSDTTLRILRNTFDKTNANPLIINLFDFATPKPDVLFENWEERDRPDENFIYELLLNLDINGILYAYGDYENYNLQNQDIINRISMIKNIFSQIPNIETISNLSGTPKHPMVWQTQNLINKVKENIKKFIEQCNNRLS
jgi:hypothetical protein